jgi:hypothetical protein
VSDVLDLIVDALSIASPLSLIDGPNFNPDLVSQIQPLLEFVKESLVEGGDDGDDGDSDSKSDSNDDGTNTGENTNTNTNTIPLTHTSNSNSDSNTKIHTNNKKAQGENRIRATQILFGAALARGSLAEVTSSS